MTVYLFELFQFDYNLEKKLKLLKYLIQFLAEKYEKRKHKKGKLNYLDK